MTKTTDPTKTFHATLDELLKTVDAPWLAYLLDSYTGIAKSQLKRWKDYLSAPEPKEERSYRGRQRTTNRRHPGDASLNYVRVKPALAKQGWRYVRLDKWDRERAGFNDARAMERREAGSYVAEERRVAQVGDFDADLARAKSDAKRVLEDARHLFLSRNSEKLARATTGLTYGELTGAFTFTGSTIEGRLSLTFADERVLRTHTYIKHNTSVHGLPFLQYPTTFWLDDEARGLDDLAENFADTPRLHIPETVQGLDLTHASKLANALTSLQRYPALLDEAADWRAQQRIRRHEKGDRTQATKARRALNLPDDITADEAVALFVRSFPQELRDRFTLIAGESQPEPPAGKKGKALRELDKALEKLGLVYRSGGARVSTWGTAFTTLLTAAAYADVVPSESPTAEDSAACDAMLKDALEAELTELVAAEDAARRALIAATEAVSKKRAQLATLVRVQ